MALTVPAICGKAIALSVLLRGLTKSSRGIRIRRDAVGRVFRGVCVPHASTYRLGAYRWLEGRSWACQRPSRVALGSRGFQCPSADLPSALSSQHVISSARQSAHTEARNEATSSSRYKFRKHRVLGPLYRARWKSHGYSAKVNPFLRGERTGAAWPRLQSRVWDCWPSIPLTPTLLYHVGVRGGPVLKYGIGQYLGTYTPTCVYV